jgi:hypothetical protein
MKVKVRNTLPRILTAIDHDPESSPVVSPLTSDPCRQPVCPTNKLLIAIAQFKKARYVHARNDQDVHGSLGVDVVERYKVLILIYYRRLDFSVSNLAEYAIFHLFHASPADSATSRWDT